MNWIGEIYQLAGRADALDDAELRRRGRQYASDTVGNGLSAIWLSKAAHDAAHESTESRPSKLQQASDEILVVTREGTFATAPRRSTIAGAVYKSEFGAAPADAKTRTHRNREIWQAKGTARKIANLLTDVFDTLQAKGIEGVQRAGLKDNKWAAQIKKPNAKWKEVLKP